MTGVIAAKELRGLLVTPMGWAVLAVNALAQGLIFYRLVQSYQTSPVIEGAQAGVTYNVVALLFGASSYVALLLVPVLTMGAFSSERSRQTWPLLASAPVRDRQLVLGKYLAVLIMILLMLATSGTMAWSLSSAAELDAGLAAAALLGAFLTLAAYAAIGLFMSSWAATPALAGAATLFALLLFWLFELLGTSGVEWIDRSVSYLSLFRHLEPLLRGEVTVVDLSYFVLLIALGLTLTTIQVRRLRSVP